MFNNFNNAFICVHFHQVLTNEIKPIKKKINYGELRRKKIKALLFKNMQQFGRHPG